MTLPRKTVKKNHFFSALRLGLLPLILMLSSCGGQSDTSSNSPGNNGSSSLTSAPTPIFAATSTTATPLTDAQALLYIASYADLIVNLGTNIAQAKQHWLNFGYAEGRVISFQPLNYTASYPDLIQAFGTNGTAATFHFIQTGYYEGRTTRFDPLKYIASNPDLIFAFQIDGQAGATHYINTGFYERRASGFDALQYIASYSDLLTTFGTNLIQGEQHYIQHGYSEGRIPTFNSDSYYYKYIDLANQFGNSRNALTTQFISAGYSQGRTDKISTSVPRFAYAANGADNSVSIFTVNATSGQLRHNGYIIAGTNPKAVAIDPSSKFAYVVNTDSNDISAFSINQSNGALTKIAPAVHAGLGPSAMTVNPSGKFAYVTNSFTNDISMYAINPSTGALTTIGGTVSSGGANPSFVTVNPSGTFAYVINGNFPSGTSTSNSIGIFSIDPSTGVLKSTGPVFLPPSTTGPPGNGVAAIRFNPTGNLAFILDLAGLRTFSVSPTTGSLTLLSSSSTLTSGTQQYQSGFALSPTAQFAYVIDGVANTVAAFSINTTSGNLTAIAPPVSTGRGPTIVNVDPSGKFLYVNNGEGISNSSYTNNGAITTYSIDAGTGALSKIGNIGGHITSNFAISNGTIPITYVPQFAYVTNSNDNTVSVYSVNTGTGDFTAIGPAVATGINPVSVAVNPSGTFAYVVNQSSNDIYSYSIQPNTGALSSAGPAVSTGSKPQSITIDPTGRFAYVANSNSNYISAYRINTSTGTLTPFGNFPLSNSGAIVVVAEPSGRYLYALNQGGFLDGYGITPANGSLIMLRSTLTSPPFATDTVSLAADPTATYLYSARAAASVIGQSYLYGSNFGVGANLFVADGTQPVSVAADPTGRFIYAANQFSNNVSNLRSSIGTTPPLSNLGPLSIIYSPVAAGVSPSSVTVEPSGKFLYAVNKGSNDISIYTVNEKTGEITSIGERMRTGGSPSSIAISAIIR